MGKVIEKMGIKMHYRTNGNAVINSHLEQIYILNWFGTYYPPKALT